MTDGALTFSSVAFYNFVDFVVSRQHSCKIVLYYRPVVFRNILAGCLVIY